MQEAIEYRQISPKQYSRPQHRAVAHRINQRLVFDYQQYIRQPLSLACSDLKILYGRNIHSAASLALQRLGIPLMTINIMLDTIQSIPHKLRV